MRCATNGKYPQIAIFENVLGVLNIDGGRSYKTIIEAFTETEVPMPTSGKWANAGMVRGGSIDFAWVVKDSQHYHVPQRRKRVLAVADFTGRRAAEILFKSKSLSGYFAARELARKGVTANVESGFGITDSGSVTATFMAGQAKNAHSIAYSETLSSTLKGAASGSNQTPSVLCVASGQTDALAAARYELAPTLTLNHEAPYICKEQTAYGICSHSSNSMLSENPFSGVYEAETCKTLDTSCLNPACQQGGICVVEPKIKQQNFVMQADNNCLTPWDLQQSCIHSPDGNAPALVGADGGGGSNPAGLVMTEFHPDVTGTLLGSGAGMSRSAGHGGETDLTVAYSSHIAVAAVDCRNYKEIGDMSSILQAKTPPGHSLNYQNPVRIGYIVRRLTPTECERLMA